MRWKSLVRFGRRVAETDRSKDRHRAAARPHTKLRGPAKGVFYQLYVLIDIYSRYAVGWMVASRESGPLAEVLIRQTCAKQGISRNQLTIHADRGTSMTSKTVATLLDDLNVARSHSRPRVSNDCDYRLIASGRV